ncbi:MAG: hypothetical protein IME93_07210 [Proteobacteria bacterium]|nr:hypothetical protein [Pseudomonadota bacterium]
MQYSPVVSAENNGKSIRIVLSKSGPVYDKFAASLSKKIHLTRPNIPVEIRVLASMDVEQDAKLPPALYVPVGVNATRALISVKSSIPLIAALVPDESFRILRSKGADGCRSGKLCSAIVLDQPPSRQLALISNILGKKVRVGILAGSDNMLRVNYYQSEAKKAGIVLDVEKIGSESELVPGLERLLKRTDMLVAVPDPVVFNANTIKHILLTTYRYRRPLTAYSPGYVKAGALAAIYSTPEDVAHDLASWLHKKWFNNGRQLPGILVPESYSVELNEWVAKSLGIKLPEIAELKRAIDKESGK